MSYASTTPVSQTGGEIKIDTTYEYSKSQTTSSSYSVTGAETKTVKLNVCCPPDTSCTWSTYQGQGDITATYPAQAELATRVTFKTGSVVTYRSYATWSGQSSYDTVLLVLTTIPPPPPNSTTDSVANYCSAGSGRHLSAPRVKAKEYKFNAVYVVPRPTKLSKIVKEMGNLGVTRKNLVYQNPFLSKVGVNGTVPGGTKLKYTYKGMAFVQALPVKP